MLKVGFIGAGKIAQALAKGFISAGELILIDFCGGKGGGKFSHNRNMKFSGLTKGENIIASSAPQDKPCIEAFQAMGASAYFDNKIVVEKSDVVLVAVKPHIVPTALSEVKSVVTPKHLILSVAMGVTLEDLEKV